ncbi:hypothetical protein L3Y34_017787 [Caenorhabditis briggsae]|uniref:Uncharacterized protein n=1 Tax=Caenorhabditis briggsae TaxID=6238 RepID=A0AAE9DJX4_CAEBR|nr:hypothetical protein L3Y34_017787 [Caenorhabditis briggsae]
MKLIVLLAFGIFTIFSFIGYNVNNHQNQNRIKISKYHEEKDISRYRNIRRIRDGQLWIHNTEVVSDLRSFSNQEKVNCKPGRGKRESSAVRVDATNTNLENIDLPKLTRSENCDRLVTVYGEKNALPKYSESSWMKKNKGRNLIAIQQEQRRRSEISKRSLTSTMN